MRSQKRTTHTKQFVIGVERALRRAAKVARQTARAHHTLLYIWRNGKVVAKKP